MRKIAVISAILEDPKTCQNKFNEVVSSYNTIIKGRMGIPFYDHGVSIISLTVVGTLDEINSFTGKLGKIQHVFVKTAFSKKEV